MSIFGGDIIFDKNGYAIVDKYGDLALSISDEYFLSNLFTSARGSWNFYPIFGFNFNEYFGRYVDGVLIQEIKSDIISYFSSHFNLQSSVDIMSDNSESLDIYLKIMTPLLDIYELIINLNMIEKSINIFYQQKNEDDKNKLQKIFNNKYQKRA